MNMRMLSKYIIMILSAMRFLKMLFIIIWNVAGLLVILKNITKSLKSLQLVWKMIFHLLSILIHMLLKP